MRFFLLIMLNIQNKERTEQKGKAKEKGYFYQSKRRRIERKK